MGEPGPHDDVDRLRTEVDNLRTALTSRDVIGQAKGILMERHGLGPDEAFARLVRISQTTNTKLHVVATMVVAGSQGADGPADGAGDGSSHPEGGEPDATGRERTGID